MGVQKPISSLLPYIILFVVVGSARSSLGRDDCSSTCGSQSISYPFRLQGDPPNCGLPNFELICAGNKTIFELYGGKYYVIKIFYENSTIQMVDPKFASGQCRLPSGHCNRPPFPSDSNGIPFIRDGDFKMYYSLASFVNCSKKVYVVDSWQDRYDSYQIVPCLSGNDTFVYVVDSWQVGDLFPSCCCLSMFLTNRGGISSGADVFQTLKNGFFHTWTIRRLTISQTITRCLKESLGRYDWNTSEYEWRSIHFSWFPFPYNRQSAFFSCLQEYKHYYRVAHVPITLAWVCVISLDIVIILLEIAALVRFIIAPLSILVFLSYECWKTMVPIDSIEKFLRNQQTLAPKRYAYSDIIAMTRHFKEKLGQGGFGLVYKGELPGGNLVAIKILGNSKCNGEEFTNEISTIGRIHHLNVVRLVGFCSEGSNRALVYEFMPNGSLDKHIFSSNGTQQRFTMEKLLDIALGVARGLDYLHRGCDMRILHFDIKPHNILLDHHFNPKVSDFGLAKLYPKEYSLVSISMARGTIGYTAPELVSRSFGAISHKSDVYSFGMLLLEMAGGRRNVDRRAQNSSQVYYPSWIFDRLLEIEGSEICNTIEIDDMEKKLCKVGLWCIQMRPSDRPSMSRVIEMLEAEEHTLQMPPKPFLSTSGPLSVGEICVHSSSSELSTISEDE